MVVFIVYLSVDWFRVQSTVSKQQNVSRKNANVFIADIFAGNFIFFKIPYVFAKFSHSFSHFLFREKSDEINLDQKWKDEIGLHIHNSKVFNCAGEFGEGGGGGWR